MLKNQTGFTLIELLVVIAIIGILAATILASLNDARLQGVEAKVKSEMDSLAKRAAIEQTQSGTYDYVCGTNGFTQSSKITEIISAINSFASTSVVCNSDTTEFATSVGLESSHWCIDSLGNKKEIPAALTTSPAELVCP